MNLLLEFKSVELIVDTNSLQVPFKLLFEKRKFVIGCVASCIEKKLCLEAASVEYSQLRSRRRRSSLHSCHEYAREMFSETRVGSVSLSARTGLCQYPQHECHGDRP